MSASAFPKAVERGTGRSLNVETVACGKHREGFLSNLNAFSVAETFIRTVERTSWVWWTQGFVALIGSMESSRHVETGHAPPAARGQKLRKD